MTVQNDGIQQQQKLIFGLLHEQTNLLEIEIDKKISFKMLNFSTTA